QERMAGNVSQANVDFQSAERTLRSVEQRIKRDIDGMAGGLAKLAYTPDTLDELGLERNDCSMAAYSWPEDSGGWQKDPNTGGEFIAVELEDSPEAGLACRPVEGGGIRDEIHEKTPFRYFLVAAR